MGSKFSTMLSWCFWVNLTLAVTTETKNDEYGGNQEPIFQNHIRVLLSWNRFSFFTSLIFYVLCKYWCLPIIRSLRIPSNSPLLSKSYSCLSCQSRLKQIDNLPFKHWTPPPSFGTTISTSLRFLEPPYMLRVKKNFTFELGSDLLPHQWSPRGCFLRPSHCVQQQRCMICR